MANKTLMYELVGRTFLVVHSLLPIDQTEWDGFVEAVATWDFDGMVIWSKQSAPNASQRTSVRKAHERRGRVPLQALLTDSPMAGVILSIINIFTGGKLKRFAPDDFAGAFAYLGVPPMEHDLVRAAIGRLRQELRKPGEPLP
jgi:hypothetical protein